MKKSEKLPVAKRPSLLLYRGKNPADHPRYKNLTAQIIRSFFSKADLQTLEEALGRPFVDLCSEKKESAE